MTIGRGHLAHTDRRGQLWLGLVVLYSCLIAVQPPLGAAEQVDARVLRVEGWLKAILHHQPGVTDDEVRAIRSWSVNDVDTLAIDERVLVELMADPTQSSFTIRPSTSPGAPPATVDCLPCLSQGPGVRPRSLAPTQRIRYAAAQLHRLQVLACAASGRLTEMPCLKLHASAEVDVELHQLSDAATASRSRGDDNYVLRRGALLHSDLAMSNDSSIEPLTHESSGPAQSIRVEAFDGQPTGVGLGAAHWEMARVLLDAVRPRRDEMVRLWYARPHVGDGRPPL